MVSTKYFQMKNGERFTVILEEMYDELEKREQC